jgi:GntR family transcriptional regulator
VEIHISASDGVPIYQQIVNQVKYLVAAGRLASGEELPPIRVLAERLVINPNTVARAYRELEIEGVVEKRRTAGTFVAEGATRLNRRERIRILDDRIDALLAESRHLGFNVAEVVERIQERDDVMQRGHAEKPR